MNDDEAYKEWAKKYIRNVKLREDEDYYILDKAFNHHAELTSDEIAQLFSDDSDDEEYLYERAYCRGWNDAIDHIIDLLKYEFKRR